MFLPLSVGALCLGASSVLAATGGSFDDGGNTLISAMMMFLGNADSVYILDKAEANDAQINGHPAWGALWDIKTRQAQVMDIRTNSFCASGMHLPNGSYVAFGGNDAVTTAGAHGSQKNADGTGAWDSLYQDFDGRKAIRIVNPCRITDNLNSGNCMWYDDPTNLSMKKRRWYSAAEATGEGQIVILGGFVNGGYINRWFPVTDPITQNGGSEPSYEYYPAKAADPQNVNFLIKASGLNAYAHTFLMPDGRMLLQANLSTTLWDHVNNKETPLPDMPNGVVRVYPASGAVAMLPLTPANNYTPTLLFCGGSALPDASWGDYGGPGADVWTISASRDCQRLTPEPVDGSAAAYEQDDDMLDPRTMGQFVILPTGKVLVVNGGTKGTAGYSLGTKDTPLAQMPFGPSLATGPVFTPALYDPLAPKGRRWSRDGFGASKIPRLYHSSAILLPDASVLLAGSNPNPDVDKTQIYSTEYRADIFYPPYFSAAVRPDPQGVPSTLSYGGNPFDIVLTNASYQGDANSAADVTTVVIHRSGFTTHAMNMGQRHMQLNNTYTVAKNGTITLHVAQLPPNSNLFQPGPALLFVNVNGIPSVGRYLIVGNGVIGTQPTAPASVLPASIRADASTGDDDPSGTPSGDTGGSTGGKSHIGAIIGGVAGGVAIFLLLGLLALCFVRRRNAAKEPPSKAYANSVGLKPMSMGSSSGSATWNDKDSSAKATTAFAPLSVKGEGDFGDRQGEWDASTASLGSPAAPYARYRDSRASSYRTEASTVYDEFDPYAAAGAGRAYEQHASTPTMGGYADLPLGRESPLRQSSYSAVDTLGDHSPGDQSPVGDHSPSPLREYSPSPSPLRQPLSSGQLGYGQAAPREP